MAAGGLSRFGIAAMWMLMAALVGPFLVELLDDAGYGAVIPGLSVTASEVVYIGGLALCGPIVQLLMRKRGHRGPTPQ
jgi:hypothetical protein